MALAYSRSILVAISSFQTRTTIISKLWRSLCQLRISRTKPTRRGCRAGLRKLNTSFSLGRPALESTIPNVADSIRNIPLDFKTFQDSQTGKNLHNLTKNYLIIQNDTSSSTSTKNDIPANHQQSIKEYYVPKIMLTNVMSLIPKLV